MKMWIPTDSMMNAHGELRERMEQQRDWNDVAGPDFRNRQLEKMEKEREERFIKPKKESYITHFEPIPCIMAPLPGSEPPRKDKYSLLEMCPPPEDSPVLGSLCMPHSRKEPQEDTLSYSKMYEQREEWNRRNMQIMNCSMKSCESHANSQVEEMMKEARKFAEEQERAAEQVSKWLYGDSKKDKKEKSIFDW